MAEGDVTQEGLVKFTVKELLASYQQTLLSTLDDLKREVRELGSSKASVQDVALLAARQARIEDYITDLRADRGVEKAERKTFREDVDEMKESVAELNKGKAAMEAVSRYRHLLFGGGALGVAATFISLLTLLHQVKAF